MKLSALLVAVIVAVAGAAYAHGGNDHVRGVVTSLTPQAVTVQTAAKATKTLTITPKTEFKVGGKAAHVTDLKVGDRVVIDVPEKSTEALLIQIGTSAKATAAKKTP
jgi:hypothetical protein